MQTYTGRVIDIANPDPALVSIIDIAHHLSLENRFGGATTVGYSVAEHSVRVARRFGMEHRGRRLQALMHDAPEYVLKDLPRPLKAVLGAVYADLEAKWWAAIVQGLRLPFDTLRDVEFADNELLWTESRDLLPGGVAEDWGPMPEPLPERIDPWPAARAEAEFLAEYRFCTYGGMRLLGAAPQVRTGFGGESLVV